MSSQVFKILAIVVIVALMMTQTICRPDAYLSYKDKRLGADKYCGHKIPDTLSVVCKGAYNSMFKKDGNQAGSDDYQYYDDGMPFRRRNDATNLLARLAYRRSRRQDQSNGIYNECCLKPCTIDELLSYCADSPSKK
ncbi:probable insulin-like peptide 3 [Copidosoma floridanum]|uniref:probable insulin-like peptide 3 n=1 Tax=Copidosoma floridanum TaxID=29053 RepID=UPI0006C94458|nr:probable insulin-like peptide 3 [Copidosoma floridanum]